VAGVLRGLKQTSAQSHPAESGLGWWRRDVRLIYRPVFHAVQAPAPLRDYSSGRPEGRPILITGGSGVLGQALGRQCAWRDLDYTLTSRSALDLTDRSAFEQALNLIQPWAVINTAGWSDIDGCERDPARCFAANRDMPAGLARACAERDLPFVNFSSAQVFDGLKGSAYVETDAPSPLSVYGQAKAEADQIVLDLGGPMLVIRTGALFSPFDTNNFAAEVVQALVQGMTVTAAADVVVTPAYVPSLIDAVLDLLIDGETGLWHLANRSAISYADFAREIAGALSLDTRQIRGVRRRDFPSAAARPPFSVLASIRGGHLPPLSDGIGRFAYALRESDFQVEAPSPPLAATRPAPPRTRAFRKV
jgi:dTDP-4-dehydrorhamnose reductase